MWVYTTNEIYHHGVPGMKWGVRKTEKRVARADRKIQKYEQSRAINKTNYDAETKNLKLKYSDQKTTKKLDNALAKSKAKFDTTEVTNKYNIARQKAKKDPSYKKSEEYINAKSAFIKQTSQKLFLAEQGHIRVETLKNKGMSEKAARGKVAVEYLGVYTAATLVSTAASVAVVMKLMGGK